MRTRVWWVALSTVAVLAVTGFAVLSARRLGAQRPPSGALAGALAERVVTLMESDFRAVTTTVDAPVRCVAHPFGVRPEGVARPADATTIYAWVFCRAAGVSRLLPVAVRLDRPPSVRVPVGGEDHDRSLRRIVPADVRYAMQHTDLSALRVALPVTPSAELDTPR